MSRQLDLVATFFLVHLMSRQLIDVATSTLCSGCRDNLILSRPLFPAPVVATALCCHDLKSLQLMSRQLGVVATFFSYNCCRDR